MENKEYQLMCTYLKGVYFISTSYRKASTTDEMWYLETIVWEWDSKTKSRGSIIETHDSGIDEDDAIESHSLIIKKLNKLLND